MTFCNFWTKSKSLKSLNKISFHEHTPTHTLTPIICLHTNTCAHSHLLAPTCPNTNLQLHLLTIMFTRTRILHFSPYPTLSYSQYCSVSLSLSVLCCPYNHSLNLAFTLKLPGQISLSEMLRIYCLPIALKFSQIFTFLALFSLYLYGTSDSLSFTPTHTQTRTHTHTHRH